MIIRFLNIDPRILIAIAVGGLVLLGGILMFINAREKKSLVSAVDDSIDKDVFVVLSEKTKAHLAKKPWSLPYKAYKTIAIICFAVFAVIFYLVTGNIIFSLLAGCAGLLVPEGIMLIQNNKRKTDFEDRFARSLRQLSASLKAGRSVQQAVDDVCHSDFIHETVKEEYTQLNADLRIGVPLPEAFNRFAARINSQDARDVAIAIEMQLKVGGREAQVIESIAQSISSRMMTRREMQSMFAGSNLTVLVMDFLPFMIVVGLAVFGNYMDPIKNNLFLISVAISLLIFMGFGSVVTHEMVKKMKKECGVA